MCACGAQGRTATAGVGGGGIKGLTSLGTNEIDVAQDMGSSVLMFGNVVFLVCFWHKIRSLLCVLPFWKARSKAAPGVSADPHIHFPSNVQMSRSPGCVGQRTAEAAVAGHVRGLLPYHIYASSRLLAHNESQILDSLPKYPLQKERKKYIY